jgi:enamine deaminase RidA (YjgF/YER057c/UK114 family)
VTVAPEATLARHGLRLPTQHPVVGTYVIVARTASLLFVSGHGAFDGDVPIHTGRLGEDLSVAEGAEAAEAAMLHLLATVKTEVGDLSRIARFIKVVVFVNSSPDFAEQHLVADGATDLLVRAFGDRVGRPARSAVGVAALPLGFAVEVEAIVELSS